MMNKGNFNYWIGIALLVTVISFLFYKSIFTDLPLNETLATIEEIHDLQVQLHRDLLRYRSDQIQQYDTLNRTLSALDYNITRLNTSSGIDDKAVIEAIHHLDKSIKNQATLVEDFKTHHAILQNSLFYIFNVSTDLYSVKPKTQSKEQLRITAELLTLLLEYNENPQHNIASKIYPLIDQLNHEPDTDTNALINHSLMIIERLPEIDEILNRFNSLNVETQIISLKNIISDLRTTQSNKAQIFNFLLFLFTIYLIFYILYIFISLQKNREKLSSINEKLNSEINLRTRTEKALYQLVSIDKTHHATNDEDRVLYLLDALCTALDVEYAYISKISHSGLNAKIIGSLDHGIFNSDISYPLNNTPCDEVIRNGRLVYNRDFSNYFPECSNKLLSNIESYIGIRLTDKNENIIGIIAIASDRPVADTNLAENILTIATSRAVIELEHQIEIINSKRYKQGLELIDNWIERLITEGYDKDAFFKNICRAAQEITQSQLATFPVIDNQQESYHFLAASGLQSGQLEDTVLDVDDGGLCSWAILNNKNLLINDVATDQRARKQLSEGFNIKAALVTPVTLKDKPYGAIAVFRCCDDFDDIDEQLITQFSQSVQMAIINMQLVNDMRSERERAEVTLRSIGDAVITTNIHGEIEYMNHVAETLTAWSLKEAKNRPVQEVFRIEDMDTGEPIHDVVMSCIDESITINKSILSLINKQGNKKGIESSIAPILKTSGNAEGVVIIFHDETQRRQLEKSIKHQAAHDPLTDLLNKEAFENELSDHVYDATINSKKHILCYLDLDRFKLINDTAGHSAGDQCLIQVTSVIQSCIRSGDCLGRLGGDEFGLILKNCTHKNAKTITEKIIDSIDRMEFTWDDCNYRVSVSIGINPLDSNTLDAADALRKADLACYAAKDRGRNQACFYEDQVSDSLHHHKENYWIERINEAVDNNRLRLYAQKIITLNSKLAQNNHVEILARLLDQNDQLLSPDTFIPDAERYNLMPLVDKKIISKTFSFMNRFSAQDENNTCFSINLSGDTICNKTIASHIKQAADALNIDARQVCFEITEKSVIKNMRAAKTLMKTLKADGFRFAISDFGGDLSSFQYLKKLPVDYLKINGKYVSDMVNNNLDHAMIAAINQACHILGIKTIAEHVENEQILSKLQKINVDYGQGYGIEQPKPLEEVVAFRDTKKSPDLKIVHNKP